MNFFKTGLQSVLGTSEAAETSTGAETVRNKFCFGFHWVFLGFSNKIIFNVLGGAAGRSGTILNVTRG